MTAPHTITPSIPPPDPTPEQLLRAAAAHALSSHDMLLAAAALHLGDILREGLSQITQAAYDAPNPPGPEPDDDPHPY